jgi:hypothetical protein
MSRGTALCSEFAANAISMSGKRAKRATQNMVKESIGMTKIRKGDQRKERKEKEGK